MPLYRTSITLKKTDNEYDYVTGEQSSTEAIFTVKNAIVLPESEKRQHLRVRNITGMGGLISKGTTTVLIDYKSCPTYTVDSADQCIINGTEYDIIDANVLDGEYIILAVTRKVMS